MRARWTPEAAEDLKEIADYLWKNRPAWAQSTVRLIYRSVMTLARYPSLGRTSGEFGERRELYLHPLPYLCIYRIEQDSVSILQIRHTARDKDEKNR
jgi:toxin ParE1/3/4